MLTLDKVLSIMDVFSGMAESAIDKKFGNATIATETKTLFRDIKDLFQSLTEHVISPNYSPDTSYGNNLMLSAKNNFEKQSSL